MLSQWIPSSFLKSAAGLHPPLYYNYYMKALENHDSKKAERDMLRTCMKAPYYVRFGDIKSISDLPITKKSDVIGQPKSFRVESIKHYIKKTSGTTGTPMTVYRSAASRYFEIAQLEHFFQGIGHSFHEPHARIGPNLGKKVWSIRNKQLLLNTMQFNNTGMKEMLNMLEDYKILRGPPSLVNELAKKNCNNQLDSVICVGEMLRPEWKTSIEKSFGCKVYNQYCQTELVCPAMECKYQSGMHVSPFSRVEIIDGKIIASGLINKAMPLLRYDTGDIGQIIKERCRCGSTQPRIHVQGRQDDILVTKSGRLINYSPLVSAVQAGNIESCRFIQEKIGSVTVNIHAHSSTKAFKKKLRRLFGDDMNIKVKEVKPTDGKFIERI